MRRCRRRKKQHFLDIQSKLSESYSSKVNYSITRTFWPFISVPVNFLYKNSAPKPLSQKIFRIFFEWPIPCCKSRISLYFICRCLFTNVGHRNFNEKGTVMRAGPSFQFLSMSFTSGPDFLYGRGSLGMRNFCVCLFGVVLSRMPTRPPL